MKSIGVCLLASMTVVHWVDAEVTLGINDDATALVVNVPAGELTGSKLELAYDDSVGAASKFALPEDGAIRENWANALTLSESVPAAGETFTVPLAELGVSADACFRLFSPGIVQFPGIVELLDYSWCNTPGAWVDTGVKDTDVYGLDIGFLQTGSTEKYPYLFGSVHGGTTPGGGVSIQHNNVAAGACNGAFFSRLTDNQYTHSTPLEFKTSEMNTCVFRNDSLTLNGAPIAANAGAMKWVTSPVGLSGHTLSLNRISDETAAKAYTKWYYVKFYDSDGTLMLDYVPARVNGVVGFFDRANSRFVPASGSGALAAGTVTNKICQIHTFPRLARRPAEVVVDKAAGTLAIRVNAGYGTGSKLYLAHGAADGGDDLAAWSDRLELDASIPEAGGTYTVDLVEAGLDSGRLFRVFAGDTYTPLTRVQQDSSDDYIDTGIRDYLVYGCAFGQYSTGYDAEYAAYFGSATGTAASDWGFRVWLGGASFWKNGKYRVCVAQWAGGKYTYMMYFPNQNQCNDFNVSNNVITYNNETLTPESGSANWFTQPLGASGYDIYLGRLSTRPAENVYGWWYYVVLEDRDGRRILDYQPVQNASGTAGFFDRVSGRFVTSTVGALVAGEAKAEACCMGASFSNTLTTDDRLPFTATWKGGTSGDLGVAANWACTNVFGVEIADAVPRAGVTSVTFAGPLAFNVASAADKNWGKTKLVGASLAGNCDWSAMGDFELAGSLDLAGHSLVLTSLPPVGGITSSMAGDPGVLQVTVAEGKMIDNANCALSGNLRFVKAGQGLFVATKNPQTYTAGTDVLAGMLKCGTPGTINVVNRQSCFGADPVIDVRAGGTLDIGGSYYWGYHTINLHGGTLMNSVSPALNFFNPILNLSAPSVFDAAASCDLQTNLDDLGGHTLTVKVADGNTFLAGSDFKNGTVLVTGDGCFNVTRSGAVDCSTATLDVSTTKFEQNAQSLVVSNFIVRCSEVAGNKLGTPVQVKGRFTPVTQTFPNVELQDGATLDLVDKTDIWSVQGTAENCSLSFAANATVTVDTGTRLLDIPCLVAWDENNPPAGADTLTAVSNRPRIKLIVRNDGIYAQSGIVILCR